MFEIRFQGLITQATVDDSQGKTHLRSVLYSVLQAPHLALLTVNKNDRQQGSSTEDFSNNDARCYKLTGFSKTDLPDGIPTLSLFGVPSLMDDKITKGTVRQARSDIGDGKPTTDFSLFAVPAGTLFVRNWFPDMGLFSGALYPMPRTVVFSVTAGGNVTFTLGTGKTVIVQPNAFVYITNFDENADPTTPAPAHFDAMASFFAPTVPPVIVNNPVIVKKPPFPLGDKDDDHDTCLVTQMLSVECSNTQFP